jgi:uncharacterized protein (UPF0332 family)
MNRNVGAYMLMAEEFLRDAQLLFAAGSYRSAASRAYYSYFDAVRALLASKSVFSKTHQSARALFGEHFVKDGPFDKSDTQNLHALFNLRQNSDYDPDENLDVSAVKRGIDATAEFLIQAEAYLRENQFTS